MPNNGSSGFLNGSFFEGSCHWILLTISKLWQNGVSGTLFSINTVNLFYIIKIYILIKTRAIEATEPFTNEPKVYI